MKNNLMNMACNSKIHGVFKKNLVQSTSSATLSSCAVTCSNKRIVTAGSCNIYFVENGICKAGILDSPDKYSQLMGSSPTLVSVKIVDSTVVASSGEKVKPGS
jgi:hypothetical protein